MTPITFEGTQRSKVLVVLDAQYGSCGKGAYCQWITLNHEFKPFAAVRTGGPNAGHSVLIYPDGDREQVPTAVALRHIPAAAIDSPSTSLFLPAAALVNVEVLRAEIAELENLGIEVAHRLMIDPLTTIVSPKEQEEGHDTYDERSAKFGSTGEGISATQAKKIRREATVADEIPELHDMIGPVADTLNAIVDSGEDIHIEMTQGVGLGLHYGHYPFGTSRDITVGQALSDCGLSPTHPNMDVECHMLARTFPIRVAGNSGPFEGTEISWDELSVRTNGYVKPEITTVTKRERRIAEWSSKEVYKAGRLIRPTSGILMFYDYVDPDLSSDMREAIQSARTMKGATLFTDIFLRFYHDWAHGKMDKFRRPFLELGTDIHAVSFGFGDIIRTPTCPW